MIWWIILAAAALVSLIPLGVLLRYDEKGFLAQLLLGPVHVTFYPKKQKKEKPVPSAAGEKQTAGKGKKHTAPDQKSPAPQRSGPAPSKKEGGSVEEFFPLLRLAVDACADLRRKIRVKRLDFHLTLAGEDPCSLALNYGRAWAIAGNTVMLLQRLFTIEKQDVQVSCDFAGDKSRVRVQAEIRICLGRLVGLGAVYGVRLLKEYWKRNQKGKGGAEHESETSQHAGNNHPKNP